MKKTLMALVALMLPVAALNAQNGARRAEAPALISQRPRVQLLATPLPEEAVLFLRLLCVPRLQRRKGSATFRGTLGPPCH